MSWKSMVSPCMLMIYDTSSQAMRSWYAVQKKDEKFVTLDGQERTMDENVLMICDGEKAVGIAGIMGGENSMITDECKDDAV